MLSLERGRYRARIARNAEDHAAVQGLRARCFRAGATSDVDAHDAHCDHVLVEDRVSGRILCCFRLLPLGSGADIGRSYSAQHYNLAALEAYHAPMVELGRFCTAPECSDADILRVAWGAMTAYVDDRGVEMLFGCSSFDGTEAEAYHDAFAMLRERHLAPRRWLPKVKAPQVVRFAERLGLRPDLKRAMGAMPPLLRTYLSMGGWVSDHAVVDRDLGTLHVFTALEITAIPAARKRLLRSVAG
ncbi:MAG: GNAT family N-acyltransferase [Pseudomonadota bacterium]